MVQYFMLYLRKKIRQNDGNAHFKNIFCISVISNKC